MMLSLHASLSLFEEEALAVLNLFEEGALIVEVRVEHEVMFNIATLLFLNFQSFPLFFGRGKRRHFPFLFGFHGLQGREVLFSEVPEGFDILGPA